MGGRLIAAVVAGSLVVGGGAVAWAEPEPDPSKQCKKGRFVGAAPAAAIDENQNGFVCVDPTTGALYDDKEQFAPDEPGATFPADENQDFIVCYNAESGVVTDNRVLDFDDPSPQEPCPPGFLPFPAFVFV